MWRPREHIMIAIVLAAATFTITSPAFTNDGNIPAKFTCDAGQQNPSPALAWKDAPAGRTRGALRAPAEVGAAHVAALRSRDAGRGPCGPGSSHHRHSTSIS